MYTVTVPLIQVATTSGVAVQVTKGGPVPADITKESLANLLDLGYAEKDKAVAEPEVEGPKPGTAAFILAEVGNDKVKAQAALDAENAKEKPGKGLVADLEKILGA